MPEVLLAAEVALGRLDGRMPQQELNLFQFAAAVVAQLRARSPQIVRGDMFQARPLAAAPYHVPDDILRYASSPYLAGSCDRSEDSSFRNPCRQHPLIERGLHPLRNRHRADVAALAD